MPIKAKDNGSYKDVIDLMNVDESIDYVLAKTSSSYKRVYTATRSIEDVPPTTFKSIKSGANLSDYRIYGNTSKNILPLSKTPKTETIGDILCEYDGKGTFKFTSNVDNPTYTQGQWFWVPFEEDFDFPVGISDGGRGCIQLNNDFATEYGVNPYFVSFANRDNGEFISGFGIAGTRLNNIDYNYDVEDLEGLPANCIVFQQLQSIGKRTVTIKPALYLDVRTQQPFEPYGESVGDRTGNLFEISTFRNGDTSSVSYDVTFTVNNDAVSISGVSSGQYPQVMSQRFELITGETYSAKIFVDGTYNGRIYIMIRGGENQDGSDEVNYKRINVDSGDIFVAKTYNSILYVAEGSNKEFNATVKVMLIEGSTLPDSYEPYGYSVPVTVEGKNLFDETYPSIVSNKIKYKSIYVGDGQFTLSTTASVYSGTTVLFLLAGIAAEGADSAINGVHANQTRSVASIDGYVTIAYRIRGTIDPQNYNTMLNAGSTPLPYEPYRAPVTTPIYLPEPIKMVGDEAEYIDYGEQKQHRVRKNLFDSNQALNGSLGLLSLEPPLRYGFPGTLGGDKKTYFLPVTPGEQYTISMSTPGDRLAICGYYNIVNPNEYTVENKLPSDTVILPVTQTTPPSTYTFTVPDNVVMVSIYYSFDTQPVQFQIEKGSEATTYEPYIENTDLDVTLPALPTLAGTNVLSVGTEVQPSKIDITGHIKTISGGS